MSNLPPPTFYGGERHGGIALAHSSVLRIDSRALTCTRNLSSSMSMSMSMSSSSSSFEECVSPWASLLSPSRDIPLIILLSVSFFLVIEKLNDWHVFYQFKLVFEWLFYSVPLIDVALSAAELEDDGIKTKPSEKLALKDPKKPGFIQCFDPSTKQHLGQVKAMTKQDVHDCCVKAAQAQKEWAKTSYSERRKVLRTIQKYIVHHIDEICRVCTRDSGKPKVDALLGEVLTTCEKIRCINSNGELWLQSDSRPTGPVMMHKREYCIVLCFDNYTA